MTTALHYVATNAPPAASDEAARRRIRDELDATLIVEAAAGTGKTSALVGRIVASLRAGVTKLDRIISVTFTEKAAGEMKLRLRGGLEKARTDGRASPEERARLDAALAQLEVARIGTIHSLCSDLLRERPVEARVDPLFEVLPEDEAERIFDQTFDAWFHEALKHPPEGVRRALRRGAGGSGRDRRGPRETLRRAAWGLVDHRDFGAPWRRDPIDREEEIDRMLALLRAIAPLGKKADRANDYLALNFDKIAHFMAELDRRELVRGRDYDALEGELAAMLRWREWRRGGGSSSAYGRGLMRADIIAERDAARDELERLIERLNADLAACLHAELRPLIARYHEQKARAGKLDFLDLLVCTRDLVKLSRAVREELQARFDRIFVDEFQDTDPLQAEILLLLAADDPAEDDYRRARPVPGKLFLVGDPKQSIYRFRRADVELYESIKERLQGQGASLLYLTKSFRSAPGIQDLVNAAFAPVMRGPVSGRPSEVSSQARYVALEKHRAPFPDQPAIVALPAPRPYDEWGKIRGRSVDASLPDGVGAFVDWLIHESGWKVSERERDEPVPLQARHICLLFKRFQSSGEDLTRAYVRALEARRIPHVLVGGRGFHDREEVQAVRNAIAAIEWPDDELCVYATLRGPLFAIPDDAILAYRQAVGDGRGLGALSPLRNTSPVFLEWDNTREVATALAILRRLHLARNERPIADTIARLLDATRAHAGIAIWPTGEQALANVLRVMDRARRFEAAGATSFRAFAERLEAEAESGHASEAPVVEEGTEGVRIMTAHRAKGLEFPVVILADPTAPAAHAQPSRYVDQARGLWAEALAGCIPVDLIEHRDEELRRDAEETVRLAYVAATRARDLLVVPVVGDEELSGWLDVLNPAIHPHPSERRSPAPPPKGCPPFGDDSVLSRPLRAERDASASVAPGLHRPRAGEHQVLWWDPRALDLGKQPEGGLRQQRILAADDRGVVSEEGVVAHAAWSERRAELLQSGALPSLPVVTATELAAEGATLDATRAEVQHEHTNADRLGRPRGKRFGILVHAILAEIDLDAGGDEIESIAAAQGRLVGASPEEIVAGIEAAKAALDHPLMVRAAESARRGECRRETPLLLPLEDGTVVEGVVDLAFREHGPEGPTWTVVDFKTDAEIEGRKEGYETQVSLYVKAIREATGEATRGVLLSV